MRLASRTTSRPSGPETLSATSARRWVSHTCSDLASAVAAPEETTPTMTSMDSAHSPVRARRFALAEMTAKLGFAAKPVLQATQRRCPRHPQ